MSEPAGGLAPAELLQVAGDLVEWVGGRVGYLALGRTCVSVHVDSQADAEHLARLLSLGEVTEYPPEEHAQGFTVWSSMSGVEPRFAVHYSGELVRPVRVFPPVEPWWDEPDDRPSDGAEAA
ncbi:hypothetical protein [Isoptericola sp. QY 916]|uniref:hypothetical protein n=1 Tax=Isoptericola sp. QY 916 TaxID=2782570 RepID=UPI003D2FEBA9|nr:hypothetical protein [Isoptericola sp. QY 916]